MYEYIALAEKYYANIGYHYLDAPWIVTKEANYVTTPIGVRDYTTLTGFLVASGEQSFIQMMIDDKLPLGKSFCITPCFRDEKVHNAITKEYFIKLELILYQDFEPSNLDDVVNDAYNFYKKFLNEKLLEIIQTPIGYDIEYNSIELGSYGIRKYKNYNWIYGTGIAEPRFTYAKDHSNESFIPFI